MNNITFIENATQLNSKNINATLRLLEEGATIPFISRYRKEATGGLDEVEISNIKSAKESFDKIVLRKETIKSAIESQDQLTQELADKIEKTFDLNELEDLYLPFKQKRKTRGDKAKELGLEPLAKLIMVQKDEQPEQTAQRFVKGKIESVDEAIQGAKDIIAEWVNEHLAFRNKLRFQYQVRGMLTSKVIKTKKEDAEKYQNYFDFSELLKKSPSYRFLAIYRASKEGLLRMKIAIDSEEVNRLIERFFVRTSNKSSDIVREACEDAFKRLLHPALENEAIQEKKTLADQDAIKVFSNNLRQLLLAPPLGQKRILAIDPGYRSGCKVVCLDASGALLTNLNIYPHAPQNEMSQAKNKLFQLIQTYKIEAIAIGNGTASRETENMVKHMRFDTDMQVFVVSEDGASVYSASSIAREEFPEYDVTVRGAVSIGRRLMDPLSELVKIDPKSIGVGQYQHEVNQTLLKESLDEVTVSCVNQVGVELNTASPYLLSYVSGLGNQLAQNIVTYRSENGPFQSRAELKKVPRLGAKAFEQCAGFLRINDSKNPLDRSGVHPEAYANVTKMAKSLGLSITELIGNTEVLKTLKQTDFPYFDPYTFKDVIAELQKPGRDPRKSIKTLTFDETVNSIEDLFVGKKLNGIVTNITNFGAFVNIGIKENGLIHKSNLADTFVENPSDFIALHEHVNVEVITLDKDRKRIGLKKI